MANTVKQRLQELKHQFAKSEKLFNELAKYRTYGYFFKIYFG